MSNRGDRAEMDGRQTAKAVGWMSPPPSRTERTPGVAENGSRSVQTVPASVGSFTRDDPRVVAALEGYLEALRAGRPWPRDEFLACHSEIAATLNECLSGLEFIQSAAASLGDQIRFL